VITWIVEFFSENSRNEKDEKDEPLADPLFRLLVKLLTSKSETFLNIYYISLSNILRNLKKPLFMLKITSSMGEMIFEILKHCNISNQSIRNKAAATFYLLIRLNWEARRSVSRIEVQATVSVSKFVGANIKKHYYILQNTLEKIIEWSKVDAQTLEKEEGTEKEREKYVDSVRELIVHLVQITKYDYKITQNWIDEEMIADLYVEISNEYVDSPDLRLTWYL